MVQEAETPVIDLELVSCGTCDTVFISSARRQTCPACGGEAIGPYLEFIVTPEGPRLKNGAVAIAGAVKETVDRIAETEPLAAEEDAAAEEESAPSPLSRRPAFAMDAGAYLGGIDEVDEDFLRQHLLDLGADPETATTTVGRLAAVRDTLASLTAPHPEPVEGEPAEELAPPAPDPEAGEGDGQEGEAATS